MIITFLYSFEIMNNVFFFYWTGVSTLNESIHMSTITTNNPTYSVGCDGLTYYYERIPMHVTRQGHYDLTINSTMIIFAEVYKNYFDPMNRRVNLLFSPYGGCIVGQTKFTINLWPDKIYYLIVATNSSNVLSSFSVVSIGPSRISFEQSSEY